MNEKHYNASYLNETFKRLEQVKLNSYQPFNVLSSGQVVDMGCGTGADVAGMAKVLSPDLRIVGVDFDETLIQNARSLYTSDRLNFVHSGVYDVPFDAASFDGMRAERLLQHLKEPDAFFRESIRILKPESPVVILETDWNSVCFYNSHKQIAQKITEYLTETKVVNGWCAKQLPHTFVDMGWSSLKIDVYPFVISSLAEAEMYIMFSKIVQEVRDSGMVALDQLQAFEDEMHALDNIGCVRITMNLVLVSGVTK